MTTSHPAVTSLSPVSAPDRGPLRIRLAEAFGRNGLDGAWWPRSRDLQVEVADLVDHFPYQRGRIDHVAYSSIDWANPAPRVAVDRGGTEVCCYPRDQAHIVLLGMANRTSSRLLVVPPETPVAEARHMMHRAADLGDDNDAESLLGEAQRDESDEQMWTDEGGSFWDPERGAPSHRSVAR